MQTSIAINDFPHFLTPREAQAGGNDHKSEVHEAENKRGGQESLIGHARDPWCHQHRARGAGALDVSPSEIFSEDLFE